MRTLLTATLLFFLAEFATGQITDVQIDAYLKTTLDNALETKDEALDRWKERYAAFGDENNIVSELIGYQPPNFLALMADISSHLYERTGEDEYAAITRELLLEIPALRALFPEEFRTRVEYQIGVPAVNWFRTLPIYTTAYMRTAESGVYSAEDREIVSEAVASSVDIVFAFPEWGAMNRALLRAESFMAAWRAFPDHPNAARWEKMGEILAEDSIGKWEIEDASIYHAVWMRAYVGYIDMAGLTDAYDSPILKYYFDYLVALMTPDGSIPEFGDGRWNTSLNEYHLALERGAREYNSPSMKWAANRMFEHMGGTITTRAGDQLPGPAFDQPSVGFARILINRRIHGVKL